MADGFIPKGIQSFFKKIGKWLKEIRWQVFLSLIIVLIVSVLLWKHFEKSALSFKDIIVEIFKAFFIFALIKILLEESPAKNRLIKEVEDLKGLLLRYLTLQQCCRKLLPSIIDANISMIFSRRTRLEYSDISFISNYEGSIKIVGVLLTELIDKRYSFPDIPDKKITFRDLLKKVVGKIKKGSNHTLEILILFPYSRGAYLKNKAMKSDQFYESFNQNLRELEVIVSEVSDEKAKIRLCHSFPSLHLILTDQHAFMQPNLLHDEADDRDKTIPMLKYDRKSDDSEFFKDLERHFDTVWKYDSIELKEFNAHFVGTHQALSDMNICNIYIPRCDDKTFDPIKRMKHLIAETREILWIKHVSMYQVLNESHGLLYKDFKDICSEIKEIKLLILDPTCDQAKMRSYREHLIKKPRETKSYQEYIKDNLWKKGPLYKDTLGSVENAKDLIKELSDMKQENQKEGDENKKKITNEIFIVKKYFAAPDSAILLTDSAVLFEPLHYGSQRAIFQTKKGKVKILSGDMPMLEVQKAENEGLYELIKDNIRFVFDNFSTGI